MVRWAIARCPIHLTPDVKTDTEALRKELERVKVERDAMARYAALGKVAMRFVDRAGDVHPGIDDAETICADFYKAMDEAIAAQGKTTD